MSEQRTEESRKSKLVRLAEAFKARSEALGYKGLKRDKALMDFYVGASQAAFISGDDELVSALSGPIFIYSIRGYSELELFLKNNKS